MKRTILVFSLALALAAAGLIGAKTEAAGDYDGQLVKMEGNSTIYYVIEGKRYVFPNGNIYASWFSNFDEVVTLPAEALYELPLAGNVRYRPGIMLVKIQTDPKVYAVARNGRLRWVKTEAIARHLYGDHWNKLIDDVPDSFFTDYEIAEPIEDENGYQPDTEAGENTTIEASRGLALGQMVRRKAAQTVRCRLAERLRTRLENEGKNIPPVLERICQLEPEDPSLLPPAPEPPAMDDEYYGYERDLLYEYDDTDEDAN